MRTSSTRLLFKSFVLLDSSVQEVCNLDSLMVFVSLFNQLCDLFFSWVPTNRFHATRQLNRFDLRTVSTLAMKILAKATPILVPMPVPCILGTFIH